MNEKPGKQQLILICTILALITCTAFERTWHNDFVNYDDETYVVKNQHVEEGLTANGIKWAFATHRASNWHPLTWLSHMLDCQLFDLKASYHHLTSLVLHVVNALLLFIVLNVMTGALWRSAFVTVLFAIHPLHVESVAWVSERKDVLSTLFWFLTICAYYSYVKNPSIRRYILALVLFVLGLMAKPMLVTLPFVFLLLDYWPLNRLDIKNRPQLFNLIREKIPFFVLSAVSCIVTFLIQRSSGALREIKAMPMMLRITNVIVSYGKYVLKMIWPTHLAAFYPHPGGGLPYWQIIAAAAVLSMVTILVIYFGRKYKYLPVGWFWYLGTLVPVIGLVQVGDQAMADRYTYVPLTGLFVIIAWGTNDLLAKWRYRKILLGTSSIAAIVILSVCTWIQTGYWRNSQILFGHALKVTSGNYVACNNLGLALAEEDKLDEAINMLERALKLSANYADAYNNLGLAYCKAGRYQEAIKACKQAIKIMPDLPEAYNNLGIAYHKLGLFAEAVEAYKQSVRIKPDYAGAYYNLGNTYSKLGRLEDAIEAYKEAVRARPNFAEARHNLGAAYLLTGDKNAAMEQCRILKTLDTKLANQLCGFMHK